MHMLSQQRGQLYCRQAASTAGGVPRSFLLRSSIVVVIGLIRRDVPFSVPWQRGKEVLQGLPRDEEAALLELDILQLHFWGNRKLK